MRGGRKGGGGEAGATRADGGARRATCAAPPPRGRGEGRGGGKPRGEGRVGRAGGGRGAPVAPRGVPDARTSLTIPLPNLPRYGRRHKAGNFGVAKFTTVILYGG